MACTHTIHSHCHHLGWDNAIDPVLSVTPEQTVAVETIDASGGQLHADATLDNLAGLCQRDELATDLAAPYPA